MLIPVALGLCRTIRSAAPEAEQHRFDRHAEGTLLGMTYAASLGGTALFVVTALAATADKKIALSNNYAANAWRQSMLKTWAATADDAVKRKLVAAAPAFTTSENQPTEQAQQIQNLILQGYKAIVVDAASPTALNGTIKKACAAGNENTHVKAPQNDGWL